MADVFIPRIERAFQQMQKPKFKICDRAAMALLFVIASSFLMYAAGHSILSIPELRYNRSADVNVLTSTIPNATRAQRRLAHRVGGMMKANCISHDDVIFGAQVLVNNAKYTHSLVYMCNNSVMIKNPRIKDVGELQTQCADENNGIRKLKKRNYPVHLQTDDGLVVYEKVQDACIIWTIIEMLRGAW